MKSDHLHAALLSVYGGVWRLARPLLRRNARLADGYGQRLAPDGWAGAAHLWVQAASGGEAYLAWELLRHLDSDLTNSNPTSSSPAGSGPTGGARAGGGLSVLLTTCTRQGIEVLEKARHWAAGHRSGLHVQVRYLPFDEPCLMRRALDQTIPRAVVLLETELWPGLLSACAARSIPVVVANGRMTARTLAGYLLTPGFWRHLAPTRIAAVSPDDARRFGLLFGHERATVMPNIKFDRAVPGPHARTAPPAPASAVLRASVPLAVLGSVREEEESVLLPVVRRIVRECPAADIAVVPRHMHRVSAWVNALEQAGLPWDLRSRRTAPPPGAAAGQGTVLIWDVFGELAALYACATAVFVGGSLARLGGQNFLEPLTHGVPPCVGPSRENFAWADQGLEEAGLLTGVADGEALAAALVRQLRTPPQREEVRRRFEAWMAPRRGGARLAADMALSVAGLRRA